MNVIIKSLNEIETSTNKNDIFLLIQLRNKLKKNERAGRSQKQTFMD